MVDRCGRPKFKGYSLAKRKEHDLFYDMEDKDLEEIEEAIQLREAFDKYLLPIMIQRLEA